MSCTCPSLIFIPFDLPGHIYRIITIFHGEEDGEEEKGGTDSRVQEILRKYSNEEEDGEEGEEEDF